MERAARRKLESEEELAANELDLVREGRRNGGAFCKLPPPPVFYFGCACQQLALKRKSEKNRMRLEKRTRDELGKSESLF